MEKKRNSGLMEVYDHLFSYFGPSYWWPGDSPLEVIIGAILTQNTAWSNVEKAIGRLKNEGALSASLLQKVDQTVLSEWIRPAGYYRIKAKRLKNFFNFFVREYEGQINKIKNQPLDILRPQLLSINGIGPETADSILLYAFGFPTFVVDTYTHRIFSRHQFIDEEISYEDLRSYFMERLPADPQLFNEYHALLVRLGKTYCKKKGPRCDDCPLKSISAGPVL
jgi:endonuclease-3 related protein